MPSWNKAMADSVIANGERLFLENGEHVTTLVDSYYIVGTEEETFETLEFTLNEARDSFILDSGSGEDNQDDVIVTKTTDGDGTVLMNSATVFESFAANRVFVKESDVVIKVNEYTQYPVICYADHTKMIKNDVSTLEFIVCLINKSYRNLDEGGLYYNFRLTQGYGGL